MNISVIDQLAHALGRRDEQPNIALAESIAHSEDKIAINTLVELLKHEKAPIRYDAIKVLYEVGERKPELILAYYATFLQALKDKDNPVKWGAMTALSVISKEKPALLTKYLTDILEAMDHGSVITRDHGIYILTDIARLKGHHDDCMLLLLEQLEKAPVNQLPMYAEKTASVISKPYIERLRKILLSREDVLEIFSKKKRIEKLLKTLV